MTSFTLLPFYPSLHRMSCFVTLASSQPAYLHSSLHRPVDAHRSNAKGAEWWYPKPKRHSGKLLRSDAIIISDNDNNYASGLRYRDTSHRRLSKPQNRTERDTHAPGALVQHGVTTVPYQAHLLMNGAGILHGGCGNRCCWIGIRRRTTHSP